jgi:DNA (cytosine-5)-methyltransferase 1
MSKKILTHGALFQGIGGFSLAARWAGIPTIWECEIDDYCNRLSKKNFPEIKTRYRDIREMLNEKTKIEKVSIVSGGPPCQPFSIAGKRRSKEDNRYLWPQTIEVIKKTRPDWIIIENVPGIINLALDQMLDDLEAAGYTQETFIVPALSVGANHRRDRAWIIANANKGKRSLWRDNSRMGRERESIQVPLADTGRGERRKQDKKRNDVNSKWESLKKADTITRSSEISGVMANTQNANGRGSNGKKNKRGGDKEIGGQSEPDGRLQHWLIEPGMGRVAHGIPRRMDRLKGLGNAIVPQIVYIFFEFIKEIEGL